MASVGASDIEELMQPFWDRPSDPDWNLIDIVQEVVHALEEPHRTIIELVFYDRTPYSELTTALGIKSKGHAWRKAQRAMSEFKKTFQNHPKIKETYMTLTVKETWDENALDALEHFWFKSAESTDYWSSVNMAQHLLYTQRQIALWVKGLLDGSADNSLDDLDHEMNVCGAVAAHNIKTNIKSDIHALHNLLVSKQRDYGHDNICLSGEIGLAVRMMDKLARLNNLVTRGEAAKNEPLEDTWCDILGYAVVYKMYRTGGFITPLKEDL
jgi:hypothetical protein